MSQPPQQPQQPFPQQPQQPFPQQQPYQGHPYPGPRPAQQPPAGKPPKDEPTDEATKAPEPKPTKKAKPSIPDKISDGTWEIGVDAQPGKYKTRVTHGANCYWQIAKAAGSDLDDILSNDNVSGGPAVVVLKKGRFFQTEDCGTWRKVG
jgi:hypothetical protein